MHTDSDIKKQINNKKKTSRKYKVKPGLILSLCNPNSHVGHHILWFANIEKKIRIHKHKK